MIMIRTVENIMYHYQCSEETAQRYIDLRDEGYPQHQALLMAGLSDPYDEDISTLIPEGPDSWC